MTLAIDLTADRAVGPLRPLRPQDLRFDEDYANEFAAVFEDDEWLEAFRGWQSDAERMVTRGYDYPNAHWHDGRRHNFLLWFPLVDGEAFAVHAAAYPKEVQPKDASRDTLLTEVTVDWNGPAPPAHDC